MNRPAPILILGAGLAGTIIAWELHARQYPFVLVDPQEPTTSSTVAAGIVNAITGSRLRLTWRAEEMLATIHPVYSRIARKLEKNHFHHLALLRLLSTPEQASYLLKRVKDPKYQPFIADHGHGTPPDHPHLNEVSAWYYTAQSGFLDTRSFLSDSWEFFSQHSETIVASPREEELTQLPSGRIRWGEREFHTAVSCTGIEAMKGSFFGNLPFRPAKGETLELQIDNLPHNEILNRGGKWLLPSPGRQGHFRGGSTYDWSPRDADPTAEGREEITHHLSQMLNIPLRINQHEAAIRPVIEGHRPVAGRHPDLPGIACLNGLGSKGVLYAPYAAQQLISHLLDDSPIDPEIDARRNF